MVLVVTAKAGPRIAGHPHPQPNQELDPFSVDVRLHLDYIFMIIFDGDKDKWLQM